MRKIIGIFTITHKKASNLEAFFMLKKLSCTILKIYIFLSHMSATNQSIGIRYNTLKRYQLIMELYKKHKTEDIPDTVILRKYICPVYPISRTTFHTIMCTPVNKEITELEILKSQQLQMSF